VLDQDIWDGMWSRLDESYYVDRRAHWRHLANTLNNCAAAMSAWYGIPALQDMSTGISNCR